MKILSSSLLIMLLALGSAMAQQNPNQKPVQQEVAEDVPTAVLSAVEKANRGFQFQEESPIVSVKADIVAPHKIEKLGEAYLVSTKSISLNGRSQKQEKAFYDADGSFVSSRTVMKNSALPLHVLRTIGKEYNGWLLVKTRAVIIDKGAEPVIYYKAVVDNGKKRENILLDRTGKIVKNKREVKEEAQKASRKVVM